MKGPVVCGGLLVAVALIVPQSAAADDPFGATVSGYASTVNSGRPVRIPDNPEMPTRPREMRPMKQAPSWPPAEFRPRCDEIAPGGIGDTPVAAEAGEAEMLRPIWSPGVFFFPPGGLTRYLFPSRAFINVEQTAPGPLSVNSI